MGSQFDGIVVEDRLRGSACAWVAESRYEATSRAMKRLPATKHYRRQASGTPPPPVRLWLVLLEFKLAFSS
jgi:hypothetical protein